MLTKAVRVKAQIFAVRADLTTATTMKRMRVATTIQRVTRMRANLEKTRRVDSRTRKVT